MTFPLSLSLVPNFSKLKKIFVHNRKNLSKRSCSFLRRAPLCVCLCVWPRFLYSRPSPLLTHFAPETTGCGSFFTPASPLPGVMEESAQQDRVLPSSPLSYSASSSVFPLDLVQLGALLHPDPIVLLRCHRSISASRSRSDVLSPAVPLRLLFFSSCVHVRPFGLFVIRLIPR